MSAYTIAWLVWFAAFGIIEGLALRNRIPGDTLSEHVWRWASMRDKGWKWRLRRLILLAFMAWLSAHMLTGGAF